MWEDKKENLQISQNDQMQKIPEAGQEISFKPGKLKLAFFLVIAILFLLSALQGPVLKKIGGFLILEHPEEKTDLIVCLAGGNVDRGLATADAYNKGLAPKVYISKEQLPDGYKKLIQKGVNYPRTIDLLADALEQLGVPGRSIFISDKIVISTYDEAMILKGFVEGTGIKSFMVITSPSHSKRAFLTFKKVFENNDLKIIMRPSPYSEFRSEDWWKKRKYIRDVIIEYQKLVYYVLKYHTF